jgi:hypothetical protein
VTKRATVVVLVTGLALAVALVGAGPAGASVQGLGQFRCTVFLPIWPATSAQSPPVDCNGKATGVVTGVTTTGQRYNLTAANDPFTGHVNDYSETCTFNEPLNGFANGTTSITGLQGSFGGGKATGTFIWTRVGITAVIALPTGTITFNQGNRKAVQNQVGRAVAVFRPVSPATGRTCAAPGPLTADIVGAVLWTG